MSRAFLLIAVAFLALSAPAQPLEREAETREKLGPPAAGVDSLRLTGTVRYVALEGGFYGIVGDDGKRYDPIALNPAFARDGMRVQLQARVLTSALSLRMWGVPIKILEIDAERSAGEEADSGDF